LIGLTLSHGSLTELIDHQNYFFHELNQARAEVDVPLLTWNKTLEAYTRNYANKRISDCKLKYSHGPYRECLAKDYDGKNNADAVRLWIIEK
jgi:uncharacterized protein YkwD